MRLNTFLLFAVLASSCSVYKSDIAKPVNPFWTKEKATTHLQQLHDSATWDKEMFKNDLLNVNSKSELPIQIGVFPVPDYNLAGQNSFKGVSNFAFPGGDGDELKIGDKTILFNSFLVGASAVHKDFVKEKKNEVFFQIIVLTDFVDTINYSHVSSNIISRNHPDYIGQGFYKTMNNKIEYTAFLTANRNAYAIINMRLFDLQMGKTILIAPQRDNSFRSMQINSPFLTSDELKAYTEKLLKEKEVIHFFTQSGTI